MRGASRGVLEVGQVRRPRACLASTHSGGPWVAVRPHYGGLPLMAGRGTDEGRRKLPGSGRAQPSRPRPEVTAPGTEIAAMERRAPSAEWRARLRRARRRHQASGLMVAPPGAPFPSHACRVYPICADKKCGGLRKAPLRWGWEDSVPGAAKNTGDRACPFDPLVPAKAGTQFWMPACAGMSGGEAIAERNVKTKPAARCQSGGWQSHGRMTLRHV